MGKVKVIGYAQREFFQDGIEYRNFTDSLTGTQLADDGGTPLFTIANFNVTTNLDPKPDKIFHTNKFSKFFTLDDINVTQEENNDIIAKTNKAIPNTDFSELSKHALFGSLKERIRVALEQIIMSWPASIYVHRLDETTVSSPQNTVLNYSYDNINNVSTFSVNVNRFRNKYNVNYLRAGNVIEDFDESTKLRNFTKHFNKFEINNDFGDFPIVEYTGATQPENTLVHFKVQGDAFPNLTSATQTDLSYHIRPNNIERERFFSNLNDLESFLLNRFKTPKYTAEFRYPVETSTGVIAYRRQTLTWPTTDGYNLDFNTTNYTTYVNNLINIAESYDANKGDLVSRFFTADALTEFDTVSTDLTIDEEDFVGQKMTKTFRVYGREFDIIKNKIEGISFANTVSYDKKNNSPDSLLKNLAKVLGWETISPVFETDLLDSFFNAGIPSYSGHSRGYTRFEAEIELWRRLILNTPWLWKSKGTRKAIEFLFRFIGVPKGLISLNEYVYLADSPQNMDIFLRVLEEIQGDTNIDELPVDDEGYPFVPEDTINLYFQKAGLWFRETGGENAVIDKLKGNNPHVGPYDGGDEYLDQFRCLIPDFSATTLMWTETTTGSTNVFRNYNKGMVNTSGNTVYTTVVDENNIPISGCPALDKQIIVDPYEGEEINECGCPDGDYSIELYLDKGGSENHSEINDCNIDSFELRGDGLVYFTLENGNVTSEVGSECCESFGFFPYDCDGDGEPECWWEYDDENELLNDRACVES